MKSFFVFCLLVLSAAISVYALNTAKSIRDRLSVTEINLLAPIEIEPEYMFVSIKAKKIRYIRNPKIN